ncbi:glycoside hydrolase family 2 protein [Haloarcula halophila]|uniref:glycoside hydrolase family 2 protein n=1 Tax=Haloarcula TaxID=2237 RepID=UPI0023E35ED8|nr:glycoside hydrolase family 2 TIM barrel-domain containing protein [Halomicroarcula sp. DFY41]
MQLLAYPRETAGLDGIWQAIPDQYEIYKNYFEDFAGEDVTVPKIYEPDSSRGSDRPTDFNITDGRSVRIPASWGEELPEFRHFEGWVWYATQFDRSLGADDGRTFLRFGAVNYRAEVWLNGERVGTHEGGFTPFSFEVTDLLEAGRNDLVVLADNNRYEDGIPNEATDWFNFGGINRSVELVNVPDTFVRNFKVETTLSDGHVDIDVTAWIDGDPDGTVTVEIPALSVATDLAADGGSRFHDQVSLADSDVDLWHPAEPTLYTVRVRHGDDTISDQVGFREVTIDGSDVVVNGERVWLRGVSLHEEADGKGRALDSEAVRERFDWLNELGCNYARLAHYPHTEEMARLADEEGILLWEEVPAYWDIDFGDEGVRELYRQQLRELVQRDWNRASVVLWSIANETDHTDATRNEVLPEMAEYVRDLDSTRLVTAACFVDERADGLVLDDPLSAHLDVAGINEYYGWYYGDATDMEQFQEQSDGTPIVVSEMGAGAKWGNHGSEDDRWTEEYQARIYREQIDAIADNDQIAGLSPWILFDFRAPFRQNEYQRGYNRKGIIDQHGRKKQAFDLLRRFYRSGEVPQS